MQRTISQNKLLEQLGERVVLIRRTKGIAQKDLAHDAGMDPSNLIRLEQGRTNPTVLTLQRLAKVLDCKIKDFFEE